MITQFKTYIVKPIPKKSGQDLHKQYFWKKDENGIEQKLDRVRTKVPDRSGNPGTEEVYPIKDRRTNSYDIGLSELFENPYKDKVIEDIIRENRLDKKVWREELERIVKEDYISKQTWAEIRFGLVPDELTERVPPKPNKDNPDTRTRVMKIKVVLYDEPNPFCEDNLNGFLAIQLMKHDRGCRVAKSPELVNTALHGWVMVEQANEHKASMALTLDKNKAIGRLSNLFEKYPVTSTLEENIPYFVASLILDNKYKPLITGKAIPAKISDVLDEWLSPRNKDSLPFNVERFNKVVDLFEKQPDLFYAKYLVQQGINIRLFQNVNSKWHWRRSDGTVSTFESQDALNSHFYSELEKIDSNDLKELLDNLKGKSMVIPAYLNSISTTKGVKEAKSKTK